MRRAYGARATERGHPLPGVVVAAAAVVTWAAAWAASVAAGAALAVAVWCVCATHGDPHVRRRAFVVLVVLGALSAWRAERSWEALAPDRLGEFTGWARVVDDPQPYGAATRVILEIDGERFEMWARGRALRGRAGGWRGGDLVRLHGERAALDDERRERVAWQHVVGEFEYAWAGDIAAGGPLARASNRVRVVLERGAGALPGADAALFRGLVIGDDRDQPIEMIERFRTSGLAHLTAVSGQNVAFILAAAGPLLRRLHTVPRLGASVALIGWFVVLTRFEPSIVRAGTMAAISAAGFALGRERSPARLLALAVTVLVVIDPLLVHSVGFQLSVGATAGVAVLGPRLAGRLHRLGPLAEPAGVTLGAQLGVAVPQLLVFGALPLVSLPANLLAVPVAGAVMLYGLPAGLLAGAVPPAAGPVMLPCRFGVRWVDTVATLAARLEPSGRAAGWGWALVALGFAWVAAGPRRLAADEPGTRGPMSVPQPPQPPEVPPPFRPPLPGEPDPAPIVPEPGPERPFPEPVPPVPSPDTPQPQPAPPFPVPDPD